MCVWEPQSVCTAVTNLGCAGSLQSKMRIPSNPGGCPTNGSFELSHVGLVWSLSTDSKMRFLHTETSPWPPLHRTREISRGFAGRLMSRILGPA